MRSWLLILGALVILAACVSPSSQTPTPDLNGTDQKQSLDKCYIDSLKTIVKETGYAATFQKEAPACKGGGYCSETLASCKTGVASANSTCQTWKVNCTALTNLCTKKFNVTLPPDSLYASYVGTVLKFEWLNENVSFFSIASQPRQIPCGVPTTISAGSVAFSATASCSIDDFGTQSVNLVVTGSPGTKVYGFSKHLSLQQRIQNCQAGYLEACDGTVCSAALATTGPCNHEAETCREAAWQKTLEDCSANAAACASTACDALKEVEINPMVEWPVLFKHVVGTCAFPNDSTKLYCNHTSPKTAIFSVKATMADGSVIEPFTDKSVVNNAAVAKLEFKLVDYSC